MSLAPLIVTLALEDSAFDRFQDLRKSHFPPHRNQVPAHLTLFHALPGEHEGEVIRALEAGSSLTAIDTAVAIATTHGAFVRDAGVLTYLVHPEAKDLRITMMSRKGLLPEADFYFPLPHGPLLICTPEAVSGLVREQPHGLLEAVFDLFRRELTLVDPVYTFETGLRDATLETFIEAYFARRSTTDPFVWAAENLREAKANHAARILSQDDEGD